MSRLKLAALVLFVVLALPWVLWYWTWVLGGNALQLFLPAVR